MRKLLLLSLFAVSCASLNAEANLVVNGSFETGDFTGWTTHTCSAGCAVQGWRVENGNAFAGSYSALTECVDAPCNDPVTGDWIKQTLATDPSQLYSLTFAYDAHSEPTTELDVYWNGTRVQSLVNITPGYNVYTVTGLVPGTSGTVLEFTGRNDPSAIFLDAVSVQATGPGSSIAVFYQSAAPTPSSCSPALVDACNANSGVGIVNAPIFVLANNGSTPMTNGVLTLVGGDTFQVPSIPAGTYFVIEPGVTNDGQSLTPRVASSPPQGPPIHQATWGRTRVLRNSHSRDSKTARWSRPSTCAAPWRRRPFLRRVRRARRTIHWPRPLIFWG